ncbi:MAG: maleylpyruvate isomerase N-terminal domain-containing protein, partial [Jiangellaceae bacterium]
MATKSVEPEQALAAYDSGHRILRDWLAVLPPDVWALPSVLPGWTVSDLGAHLSMVANSATRVRPAPRGTAPRSFAQYVGRYAEIADDIAEETRQVAGGAQRTPADVLAAMDERYEAARTALGELGPGDPVVVAPRGPVRLGDYLSTRVVEVAVHGDDLARSIPGIEAPTMPQAVDRLAVRALLDALAERAPGRSVEVRVPPYAAVPCV